MNDNLNLSGRLRLSLDDQPASRSSTKPNTDTNAEGRVAVATALAAGVTVLTAALGTFGGLTGGVARMARNYPVGTGLAVGAVVVSVALAIGARLVAPQAKKVVKAYWSTWLLILSIFLFTAGVLLAISLLTFTIGKDDRPSVAAESSRDADSGVVTLKGTAKAGGLSAEDAVHVFVLALDEASGDATQIYYAIVGPNSDGLVDHSFSVMVPPGIRSVVVTVGSNDEPVNCKPSKNVGESIDPTKPAKAVTPSDALTACALVAIPEAPPS